MFKKKDRGFLWEKLPVTDFQVRPPQGCEIADIFGFNQTVSRLRRTEFDGIYLVDYAMLDALDHVVFCSTPSPLTGNRTITTKCTVCPHQYAGLLQFLGMAKYLQKAIPQGTFPSSAHFQQYKFTILFTQQTRFLTLCYPPQYMRK